MKLLWVIQPADVGGVYRHPFHSKERATLVRISWAFGGIMKADVSKTVWEDSQGRLKMKTPSPSSYLRGNCED